MTQQASILLYGSDLPRANRVNSATSKWFLNWSCGSQSMINDITTIQPYGASSLRYHNCKKNIWVLSGRGVAVEGEIGLAVKTFDVTRTPANLPHQSRKGLDKDNIRIFGPMVRLEQLAQLSTPAKQTNSCRT